MGVVCVGLIIVDTKEPGLETCSYFLVYIYMGVSDCFSFLGFGTHVSQTVLYLRYVYAVYSI